MTKPIIHRACDYVTVVLSLWFCHCGYVDRFVLLKGSVGVALTILLSLCCQYVVVTMVVVVTVFFLCALRLPIGVHCDC